MNEIKEELDYQAAFTEFAHTAGKYVHKFFPALSGNDDEKTLLFVSSIVELQWNTFQAAIV